MAKAQGEIARVIGLEVKKCGVKASETFAKGDIVTWDSSSDCLAATTGTTTIADGFGIALEGTTSASPATVQVAVGNSYVYVEMGGDVDAFDLLKMTDGDELVVNSAPSAAAGPTYPTTAEFDALRSHWLNTVGRYVGKETDTDDVSAAADGEIGIVRLGL